MRPFAENLRFAGQRLRRRAVDVLQVNMGRYCNLACIHCHVESGPTRKEMMSRETVDAVLHFLARTEIPTLDITGGAPELHRDFDYLVEAARGLGRHVMDRCNLTVIFESGKDYLPEFFKYHQVELVCSLPCYSEENVDKQRGKGTFDSSIRALQRLNEIGYGQPGGGLILNLVYNPVVTRYATHLKLRGEYDRYVELLETNFNATTLDRVMCRDLISIGWSGLVYDCDFNQMLDMPLLDDAGKALHIASLSLDQVLHRAIEVGDHCYACTAGSGSSCGGALV